MKIELHKILVKDLVNGYKDNDEQGVWAYKGKLNIRPPFQREFIYDNEQQKKVIDTVLKGFPLNTMYWIKNSDGSFELMDGQQRTLSICKFFNGEYSVNTSDNIPRLYVGLTKEEQEQFLNYGLTVYICEGNDKEKTEWFETVNIAGEKLTDQELSNAIYRGPWVSNAKVWFSKSNCPCQGSYKEYLSGSAIRQDYLETAIRWISNSKDNRGIRQYMAEHQNDKNASELWQYMQAVMSWVKNIFPHYRKEMKGIEWGFLYNDYHNQTFNATDLEERIKQLYDDDDVTNHRGVYYYLITGDEKHLNIRAFPMNIKRKVYEKQKHKCKKCGKECLIEEMEADHITPWSQGGHTTIDNCQMLCKKCNREKSDK